MIYHFKTLDGEDFVLDVAKMRWGRVSSNPPAENDSANCPYDEEGDLIPMGAGVYNLDGRMLSPDRAMEEEQRAPGIGLSTVGILTLLYDHVCEVYLKPNVQVKEGSFTSNYLQELPADVRNKFVHYSIL